MRKRGEEGRGERRDGRGKSGYRRGERGGRKSCAPQARCSPCNDAVSLNKREKEGREKVTGRREDGTGQRRREERTTTTPCLGVAAVWFSLPERLKIWELRQCSILRSS